MLCLSAKFHVLSSRSKRIMTISCLLVKKLKCQKYNIQMSLKFVTKLQFNTYCRYFLHARHVPGVPLDYSLLHEFRFSRQNGFQQPGQAVFRVVFLRKVQRNAKLVEEVLSWSFCFYYHRINYLTNTMKLKYNIKNSPINYIVNFYEA